MSDTAWPDELEIQPLVRPPSCSIRVPGSKSITNRALVLAALGYSVRCTHAMTLTNALRSEDTEVMVDCLNRLGMGVRWDQEQAQIVVPQHAGAVPARGAELFVGNSGTTVRFLTALVCRGCGRFRLDGVPRMRERPIQDLLDALQQLGVHAYSEQGNGCPPVVVEANHWQPGTARLRGNVSSQFLSALLMVGPIGGLTIEVDGPLVSWPYVQMTLRMMRQFGYDVDDSPRTVFEFPAGGSYESPVPEYAIEPDASGASYFFAAAAITGGTVRVPGLGRGSLQGDVRFVEILEQMGCRVEWADGRIAITGGPLRGVAVDMNDISDTVMTLGAVACFAEGPTTIRNVAHIRHKETDRLTALATELRRIGAEVEDRDDGLTIHPRPLHGAMIETYNDHRMAMSLAIAGLRVPGIVIRNPGCVGKTYPGFFADLEKLR